ncbi:nuclear transport factor 2 family protein [Pseudoxanthomonas sp. 22568]|uniref:nuclear transport factor 2 family protein n=1 Tax=Pseudoxanthomonas sp. 22568 TaxID=3453945 RepID=UPI003F86B9A5
MKVRPLLLGLSLCVISTAAFAADDDATLRALAQSVLDAQIRFDVPALDRVLASDYIEISPVGDVDTRDEVLGFYAPQAREQMLAKGVEPVSASLGEPQVHVDGDHARLIALNTAKLRIQGAEQQKQLRTVFEFRRDGGHWKLASATYVPYRAKP